MAERLGLVEEPGLRPLGSRAWWLRLALAVGVVAATLALMSVLGLPSP
ncbi:hypothetical protein [Jannaschia sp. R86511]